MEFTVPREELLVLLEKAAGTVSTKDVQPILKNFLIKAEAGQLRVMATDMSLGAVADANITTVTKEGMTAVPAKKLLDMIKASPSKHQLMFRLDGQVLNVYVDYKKEGENETYRNKTVLHCMDPVVYPDFPEYKEDQAVETALKPFLEGLAKISFATADTELKANLMAVYVNDGIMYSADGHRACKWTIDGCKLQDLMIPKSAVHLLVKLLRDSTASSIKVCQTQYHILFKLGSELYNCRKLESKFPDVEGRVFKKTESYGYVLEIPKGRIKHAVHAAAITSGEACVVTLELVEDDMGAETMLVVKSKDAVDDSFEERIQGVQWNGPMPFERSINHEYLMDVVNVIESGNKPFKIYLGEDKGSRKSFYLFKEDQMTSVILPVRSTGDKKDAVHKRVQAHADAAAAKENMGAEKSTVDSKAATASV